MGGDPGADRHQGRRTRTQSANALANCAVVSVQRAEQLVSLGEPPGFADSYISQVFHMNQFTGVKPHVYPQLPHGRRKESSWEMHRIVQKPRRICTESDLGPDFIGTLDPNF
jgi:hypothetical protein